MIANAIVIKFVRRPKRIKLFVLRIVAVIITVFVKRVIIMGLMKLQEAVQTIAGGAAHLIDHIIAKIIVIIMESARKT